jgi:hypothetical protein
MNQTTQKGKRVLPGSPIPTLLCGVLLLSACCLQAQEPNASLLTNGVEPMVAGPTNEATQVEDLISAIRAMAPEEPAPGDEEPAGTNGPPLDGRANNVNPGSPAESQPYRRPSGRDSRSRWSSRQRSNSAWSSNRSGSAQASAGTNGGPASLEYSAFRLVAQRNIFDPNRHPGTVYTPPTTIRRGPEPDYFTLVGTMSYEEGTFAFFSGSSSEYQTSLKCAGTIAGYKVTAIGSDFVKLAQATNQLELRIGMQMRQSQDGSWLKSDAPSSYTVSSFEAAPVSTSASPSWAASSGTESEILKRLMEKREKE